MKMLLVKVRASILAYPYVEPAIGDELLNNATCESACKMELKRALTRWATSRVSIQDVGTEKPHNLRAPKCTPMG